MKKTLFLTLLPLISAAILSTSLSSCGDEDENTVEEEMKNAENPEDNLPETAKAFVGYWENDLDNLVSSNDFLFLGDGRCKRFNTYNWDLEDTGFWTYDEATTILATTTGGWQWKVNLSNSEAWAGVSLGSSKTCTYKKNTGDKYVWGVLCGTKWVCDDTLHVEFGDKHNGGIPFVADGIQRYKYTNYNWKYREIILSDGSTQGNTLISQYTIYDVFEYYYKRENKWNLESYPVGKGTLLLKDYKSSNPVLTFTSTAGKEYHPNK